jgi:hypothetical protein
LKNAKWRIKSSSAEEECVIVFPTDFSTDEGMTGGLDKETTARRKTRRLTDLIASQSCELPSSGRLLKTSGDREKATNMNMPFISRIVVFAVWLGPIGCAPPMITPAPQTVHRIAVLPPYQRGASDARTAGTEIDLPALQNITVGDVLAQQARLRLAEKGFEVLSSSVVKLATKDRVPTNPQMAAQILEEAHLDATALYIEVRRWEPTPSSRGMKADGVIVALDVMMIEPKTGAILWQVRRPSRPVPLYGVVLTGHANVFAAETVMREVFASLE